MLKDNGASSNNKKSSTRGEPISLRVPPDQLADWKKKATDLNVPLSSWMVKAIEGSDPEDGFVDSCRLPAMAEGPTLTIFEKEALAQLPPENSPSGPTRVLELGGGSCRFAVAAAASRNCRVTLVDRLPRLDARVKAQVEAAHGPSNGSAHDINQMACRPTDLGQLQAGTFDLIFCQNALHFYRADKRGEVLRHIRSLLSPGGVFIQAHQTIDSPLATPELGARPLSPYRFGSDDGCTRTFFTIESAIRELKGAGFSVSEGDLGLFAVRGYEIEGRYSCWIRTIVRAPAAN